MKALIMAGASKKEFTNWSRNKELPIDPVLGAGKINVQNSYHILIAGEQEPGNFSNNYGWDSGSIDESGKVSYSIKLEEDVNEASFSLNWNRVIRSAEWLDGNPYNESIADMKLELYRKKNNSLIPVGVKHLIKVPFLKRFLPLGKKPQAFDLVKGLIL